MAAFTSTEPVNATFILGESHNPTTVSVNVAAGSAFTIPDAFADAFLIDYGPTTSTGWRMPEWPAPDPSIPNPNALPPHVRPYNPNSTWDQRTAPYLPNIANPSPRIRARIAGLVRVS